MAKQKKKTKHVLRPWCWYCERDFEDEKVLMQHQKAKHFKCGHCPRKLNTAGGLAVHIQQVHKLDPEPIENALPGRNGYDVEIFGMEGIPAADVSAYKRKKEAEFSLPLGYFGTKTSTAGPGAIPGAPTTKRNYENRIYTFEELRGMLETHRQLMGRDETANANKMDTAADGPVLMAAPQILVPPVPGMPPMSALGMPPPPLSMTGPPGVPPMPLGMSPFGMPGMPPFPPGPGGLGAPPFPPGMLPPGMPLPGFAMPPPEALGGPPNAALSANAPSSAMPPTGMAAPPSISKPPTSSATSAAQGSPKKPMIGRTGNSGISSAPAATFDPTSMGLKEGTTLEWMDLNYSPLERRAEDPKYSQFSQDVDMADASTSWRTQRARARAEDFLD